MRLLNGETSRNRVGFLEASADFPQIQGVSRTTSNGGATAIMALSSLGSVVSYLRTVAPAGEGDDDQLLARVTAGDELPFAALVHRYAPPVWGVCRRTLAHPADAEDSFQATFLVLLKKAPSLGGGPLGPWLH